MDHVRRSGGRCRRSRVPADHCRPAQRRLCPVAVISRPGCSPAVLSKHISCDSVSSNPTTSAINCSPVWSPIVQVSPTNAGMSARINPRTLRSFPTFRKAAQCPGKLSHLRDVQSESHPVSPSMCGGFLPAASACPLTEFAGRIQLAQNRAAMTQSCTHDTSSSCFRLAGSVSRVCSRL